MSLPWRIAMIVGIGAIVGLGARAVATLPNLLEGATMHVDERYEKGE